MPNMTEEELDQRLSTMGLPTHGQFAEKLALYKKHINPVHMLAKTAEKPTLPVVKMDELPTVITTYTPKLSEPKGKGLFKKGKK